MTPTDPSGHRVWPRVVELFDHVCGLLTDPSERTFWGALLVTATIVIVLSVRRRSPGAGLRLAQVWNPSARVDYGLILCKPILAGLLGVSSLVTAVGVAMATVRVLRSVGEAISADVSVGMLEGVVAPSVVAVLYTIVLFVAWDFSRFALHWWMHRSTLLWQFHQVHHSATSLTPATLYRVHPVESVLYQLRGILVTGVLTGLFAFLFGPKTAELQLWGVNALGFLFSIVSGNLRHSHVWWSFGPRLERWMLSPAQHQLHHGPRAADSASNLGTWLSIWDRVAGTFRFAESPTEGFGLPQSQCNHRPDSMLSALFDPVLAATALLGRRLGALAVRAIPSRGLSSTPPTCDLSSDTNVGPKCGAPTSLRPRPAVEG